MRNFSKASGPRSLRFNRPNRMVKQYSRKDAFKISHTECVAAIIQAEPNTEQWYHFEVNPGLSGTFPWLGQIANAYESYHFNKLSFRFVSSSSTVRNGNIKIGFDTDPADPYVDDPAAMLNWSDSCSGAVYTNQVLNVHLNDRSMSGRYDLKTRNAPNDESIRTSDVGSLHVFTSCSEAGAIGDLFVDYDIELFKCQTTEPISGTMTLFSKDSTNVDDHYDTQKVHYIGKSPQIFEIREGNTVYVKQAFQGVLNFSDVARGIRTLALKNQVLSTDSWIYPIVNMCKDNVANTLTNVISQFNAKFEPGDTFTISHTLAEAVTYASQLLIPAVLSYMTMPVSNFYNWHIDP